MTFVAREKDLLFLLLHCDLQLVLKCVHGQFVDYTMLIDCCVDCESSAVSPRLFLKRNNVRAVK